MADNRILISPENLPKLVQDINGLIESLLTPRNDENPESTLRNIRGEFIEKASEWEGKLVEPLKSKTDISLKLKACAPFIFKRVKLTRKDFSEIMSKCNDLLVQRRILNQDPKYMLDLYTANFLALISLPESYLDKSFRADLTEAAETGKMENVFFAQQDKYDTCLSNESVSLDLAYQLIRDDYDDSRNTLKAAKKYILAADYQTSAFLNSKVQSVYPYPIISICQRSGTGKTRLMIEVARRLFPSVYMSLGGFTKSPAVLTSFISKLACSETDRKITHEKAQAFIVSILDYVHSKLNKSDLLSCPRTDENKEDFSKLLDSIIFPFLPSTFKDDPSKCTSTWTRIINDCQEENTAKLLLARWESGYYQGTENFPLVVIEIDEARALLEKNGYEVSPFQIIRQAAFELGGQRSGKRGFVFLFADTTFKITNFAPNKYDDPSLRKISAIGDLYPPFYVIPTHDLKAGYYLGKAREACRNDLSRKQNWAEFLTQREDSKNDWGMEMLGSPLWEAYLSDPQSTKLFVFASEKLAPTTEPIAALASRVSLVISPSSQLASQLVSHSMAHLDLVDEDRKRIHISYPSDPILATGGALYCKGNGGKVLQGAYDKIQSNEVDTGNVGELVGQVLLLSAMDRCEGLPLMSVSALDFLHHLFPTISTLAQAPFIESDVAKGKLFFNHFIQVDKTITRKEICMALIRGAAVVGKRNQEAVDVFIPVCLKDGRLSCIIVQFKNYKASIGPAASDPLFTAMDNYAVKICDGVPTVKILFNLKQGLAHYGQSATVDGNGARIISKGLKLTGHSYWLPENESFEALLKILRLTLSVAKISELEFTPLLKEFFTFTENPAHLYGDELFNDYSDAEDDEVEEIARKMRKTSIY